MMSADDRILDEALIKMIHGALVPDLSFSGAAFVDHSGSHKNGYKLRKIGAYLVEDRIPISYVYGRDKNGDYWYVVDQLDPLNKQETVVNSVDAAKSLLLDRLKEYFCGGARECQS